MRRSNWRAKVLIIAALLIGITAGIVAAVFLPEAYALYRGLCVFGTIALVSGGIIFAGTKIFRIGEE